MPRNRKEFALYMAIVSLLSVNIIAPLITCFEAGFRLRVWADVIRVLPFIWLSVIALVLITFKPAEYLTRRIVAQTDSFNSKIIVNILCSVFLMSIFLTVIGTWIGTRQLSMDPLRMFFHRWPRSFAISFAVEALVAQPAARLAMAAIHRSVDKAKNTEKVG